MTARRPHALVWIWIAAISGAACDSTPPEVPAPFSATEPMPAPIVDPVAASRPASDPTPAPMTPTPNGALVAIDGDVGRAMLEWIAAEPAAPDATLPPRVAAALPWLAFAASVDEAAIETALRAARAGDQDGDATSGLRFGNARRYRDESAAAIARAESALRARVDVVGARVRRLLPDAGAATPPFTVLFVAGLPDDRPLATVADGERRILVVEAPALNRRVLGPLGVARSGSPPRAALASRLQDALGEELERIVAPELFHAAFSGYVEHADTWQRWPMHDPHGRAWFAVLDEAVGAALEIPRERAIDDRGRRPPQVDVEVRRELARFEANLARMVDRATPPDDAAALEWSMWNGVTPASADSVDGDDRWGTRVVARMVEAVDKLGAPGRLREVLERGPFELFEAYVEVSGRSAAVPPLDQDTKDRLRSLRRELQPR